MLTLSTQSSEGGQMLGTDIGAALQDHYLCSGHLKNSDFFYIFLPYP